MAEIMDGAVNQAPRHLFCTGVHGQLVSSESFQTCVQLILHEDAVEVTALAPHVIHAIAVSGKSAIPHLSMRIPEDRQRPIVYEGPLDRVLRYRVFARIGDVAHKQTVDDTGGASGQQVHRRTGALRAVPEKHTVLDYDRRLVEALVLDRDAGAARIAKVIHDFDVLNRWIGTAKN